MKHHEDQPGQTPNLSITGTTLADPNPNFSIEEVRSFSAAEFPELTNAAITGPETVGDRTGSTPWSGPSDRRADEMTDANKRSLLQEIRESEDRQRQRQPSRPG